MNTTSNTEISELKIGRCESQVDVLGSRPSQSSLWSLRTQRGGGGGGGGGAGGVQS